VVLEPIADKGPSSSPGRGRRAGTRWGTPGPPSGGPAGPATGGRCWQRRGGGGARDPGGRRRRRDHGQREAPSVGAEHRRARHVRAQGGPRAPPAAPGRWAGRTGRAAGNGTRRSERPAYPMTRRLRPLWAWLEAFRRELRADEIHLAFAAGKRPVKDRVQRCGLVSGGGPEVFFLGGGGARRRQL